MNIGTNDQDLCHYRWVDLELGERCVAGMVTQSRRQQETKKGASAWHTNLVFVVETVSTGGSFKNGFRDVVGVICDTWVMCEGGTDEMCVRVKIEACKIRGFGGFGDTF